MSAHMNTHHTRKEKNRLPKFPLMEDKTIPWREEAKEQIAKYTESGLMLRGARSKENMTQKQLADLLNIKPHHISEMEHGKRTIGKKMAHKLADILNVNYIVFL